MIEPEKSSLVPGESQNANTSTLKGVQKLWESVRFFKLMEFDSPDAPGSGINMNVEFVLLLDKLREKCGFPLQINSAYRTPDHNRKVGGVSESAHIKGCACDLRISSSLERYLIVQAAMALGFTRIGVGKTFIHVDMDFDLPQRVLWVYD